MEFKISESQVRDGDQKSEVLTGRQQLDLWLASPSELGDLKAPRRSSELGDGNATVEGDIPLVRDGGDIGQSPSVLAQAAGLTDERTAMTGKEWLRIVANQKNGEGTTEPNLSQSAVAADSGAPLTGKAALAFLARKGEGA